MAPRVAACVWRSRAEVVLALDHRFGDPVDAYVNGSQVWLLDNGPRRSTLEWRLHPVAGFRRPSGVSTHDLFPSVALALAEGEEGPAPLPQLWGGLEAFSAYGEELEPAPLATAATAALGIAPDATGMVDHAAVGDRWEAAGGRFCIVAALLEQLGAEPGR